MFIQGVGIHFDHISRSETGGEGDKGHSYAVPGSLMLILLNDD